MSTAKRNKILVVGLLAACLGVSSSSSAATVVEPWAGGMPLSAGQFTDFVEGWGTVYNNHCLTDDQDAWVVPLETDSSSGTYDYSAYLRGGSSRETCTRSESKNPNGTLYSASGFVCNSSTIMSLVNGNAVYKPTNGTLRVAVYLGTRYSNCSGTTGAVGSVSFWRQ